MVDAGGEWGGRGPAECEVPFEDVGGKGCCVVVWRGGSGEFGGFAEDTFYSGGFEGVLRGSHGVDL